MKYRKDGGFPTTHSAAKFTNTKNEIVIMNFRRLRKENFIRKYPETMKNKFTPP